MLICILKNAKKQCLMEDVVSEKRGEGVERCVLMLTAVFPYNRDRSKEMCKTTMTLIN